MQQQQKHAYIGQSIYFPIRVLMVKPRRSPYRDDDTFNMAHPEEVLH